MVDIMIICAQMVYDKIITFPGHNYFTEILFCVFMVFTNKCYIFVTNYTAKLA